MLTHLQLQNFRGFRDHALEFKERTIIVGRNNAGKSTIVEALRLVALITGRVENASFGSVPDWMAEIAVSQRGIQPDLTRADFDFTTATYRYDAPPSVITATFSSGAKVKIFVGGPGQVHAALFDPASRPVADRSRARALGLPHVGILPQVGPLQVTEEVLRPDYVRRMMDSPLASQHFRNQLLLDENARTAFAQLVEQTWPGVRIRELEQATEEEGPAAGAARKRLTLMVQNGDFVAEAARMGHGLQMWLQTMWFLARTPSDGTVILDEPDVYMHPDLQRRLVRVLWRRHRQTVVATHSAEIMAEVNPDEILVVERERARSTFATSLPAAQRIVDALGSVHNLHVARLWSSRKFLLVEGDDIDLLGPLHAALFPDAQVALQSLPRGSVGGWSGWERVVGSTAALRNAVGENITVYSLFDADYRPSKQIEARYDQARGEGVELHVWEKKELENYFLVPQAIARVIARRNPEPDSVDSELIAARVDEIVCEMRMDTIGAIATELQQQDKRLTAGTAMAQANARVEAAWSSGRSARWAIVCGKDVLSSLSAWSKQTFNVSFSPVVIARSMVASDIEPEMKAVLTAIETGTHFGWPTRRPAVQ